jgi:hypothetical protein
MRELTFDECQAVAGSGRWGAFFRMLKEIFVGGAGGVLAQEVEEATEPPPEQPPTTFDPTNETFVAHGDAWGQDANGNFQSGQYWMTPDGVIYYDMDNDGQVESATYQSEDGTVWQNNNLDGNWSAR